METLSFDNNRDCYVVKSYIGCNPLKLFPAPATIHQEFPSTLNFSATFSIDFNLGRQGANWGDIIAGQEFNYNDKNKKHLFWVIIGPLSTICFVSVHFLIKRKRLSYPWICEVRRFVLSLDRKIQKIILVFACFPLICFRICEIEPHIFASHIKLYSSYCHFLKHVPNEDCQCSLGLCLRTKLKHDF